VQRDFTAACLRLFVHTVNTKAEMFPSAKSLQWRDRTGKGILVNIGS